MMYKRPKFYRKNELALDQTRRRPQGGSAGPFRSGDFLNAVMGKKLAYERYYWFHGQLKAERWPNARKLAEEFEVSQKQAQRDIEFMRDRLGAPLSYHHEFRGYKLDEASYELPPVWFHEDELIALCLSLRLASTLPDPGMKKSLRELLEKFLTFRFLDSRPTLAEIIEKVSVKNVEYSRVNEVIFRKAIGALFGNRSMKIVYYSPHKHEASERIIHPLHLLCYMGSWHLIAYCSLKHGLRDFSLSRMRGLDVLPKPINLPKELPLIRNFIKTNFGLMTGKDSIGICLKFVPKVSNWISEQIWFSGQDMTVNKDGSICLRFPVADFAEIKKEVLKYGASVEVLSPIELREQIKEEIVKISKIYAKDKASGRKCAATR